MLLRTRGWPDSPRWFATTPQNIGVSNLGVVDDAGDPAWGAQVSATLGASPNQVVFITVTTSREKLILNVTTDRARMPSDVLEQFLRGFGDRIGSRRQGDDGGGPR